MRHNCNKKMSERIFNDAKWIKIFSSSQKKYRITALQWRGGNDSVHLHHPGLENYYYYYYHILFIYPPPNGGKILTEFIFVCRKVGRWLVKSIFLKSSLIVWQSTMTRLSLQQSSLLFSQQLVDLVVNTSCSDLATDNLNTAT